MFINKIAQTKLITLTIIMGRIILLGLLAPLDESMPSSVEGRSCKLVQFKIVSIIIAKVLLLFFKFSTALSPAGVLALLAPNRLLVKFIEICFFVSLSIFPKSLSIIGEKSFVKRVEILLSSSIFKKPNHTAYIQKSESNKFKLLLTLSIIMLKMLVGFVNNKITIEAIIIIVQMIFINFTFFITIYEKIW